MSKSAKKIGLALGGGAALGIAHIGVLKVLETEGIPIDMIAGTSIGAIIGALYAQGKSITQIKEVALELSARRLTFLFDPALPKAGFLRGQKIGNLLKSTIGDVEFASLKIPFACVAADLDSGQEVVIKQGLVWEGVRASSLVPVLFKLVRYQGKYLVDGTLVNPVPVRVLKEMGADFIIAVTVISGEDGGRSKTTREPSVIKIIIQAIYIGAYSYAKASIEGADMVIEPRVAHIGPTNFRRARECILQGELAAQASIPEIKKLYFAQL